jgi:molybdopterin-synthase adenylyltransferase
VASLQAVAALKLLSGNQDAVAAEMMVIDPWKNRIHQLNLADARREDCRTCGQRQFDALEGQGSRRPVSLCGRNAVQVIPQGRGGVQLDMLAKKLEPFGVVTRTPYLLRLDLNAEEAVQFTVFPDGRLIVSGTTDLTRARSLYARYIGA